MVTTFSNYRSGCYLGESNPLNQINEEIIVLSGEGELVAGTVLGGPIFADTPTATAGTPVSTVGGTVGNGTISAITADAGAPAGDWTLECTATGATGKFKVLRPDGSLDGTLTIGSAYNGGINLTVSDGSNDWLVGDIIPVSVAYDGTPQKKYVAHDPSLTNGGENAAAILFHTIDATSADVKTVATVRGPATIINNMLTWDGSITAAQKLVAQEALRAKGLAILPQHAV